MNISNEKPVMFIIFGATGDLATKKLFPALFALFRKEKLPLQFSVLAVSRRDWIDTDFRSFIREKMPHYEKEFLGDFLEFLDRIYYSQVFFDQNKGYHELHEKLHSLDSVLGVKTQKIFYLSLAPAFYENVFNWLGEAKLFEEKTSRLLVEKPFGVDEKSADELHRILRSHLRENQLLFVDHYLGKDTLRAIRALHSSTSIFDSVLTNKNVESIRMRIFETHGIEKRGASYDAIGAFRDIAQNHMMIMLATIVAPCRGIFSHNCRSVRARAIASLAFLGEHNSWARGGQYVGYSDEENVSKNSITETAFSFNTVFTRGKLKGVRVLFEGGKKLPTAKASIEIFLKDGEEIILNIQPEQSVVIKKASGQTNTPIERKGDSYEHIFVGAMNEDTRMFASFKEIKVAWRLTDSVIKSWKDIVPVKYSLEKPFIC